MTAFEIAVSRSGGGIGCVRAPNPRLIIRRANASSRQTGQLSRCSSTATRTGKVSSSSMYRESDCLVSSHNIKVFPISDLRLPIEAKPEPRVLPTGNWQSSIGNLLDGSPTPAASEVEAPPTKVQGKN